MNNSKNYLANLANQLVELEFDDCDMTPNFSTDYIDSKTTLLTHLTTKKAKKHLGYKTAAIAIATILICSTTAIAAATIYHSKIKETGFLTTISITQTSDGNKPYEAKYISDHIDESENVIPYSKQIDFSYLPKGFIASNLDNKVMDIYLRGSIIYAKESSINDNPYSWISITPYLYGLDEDGTFNKDILYSTHRTEFDVENGTGYLVETTNSYGSISDKQIYLIRDSWDVVLELICSNEIANEELIKVAKGVKLDADSGYYCEITPGQSTNDKLYAAEQQAIDAATDANDTIATNDKIKMFSIGETIANVPMHENHYKVDKSVVPEEEEYLWGSIKGQNELHDKYGSALNTFDCKLDLTINEVQWLDSIKDLDITKEDFPDMDRETLANCFDKDGTVLPATIEITKLGDGVNTIDTVIDTEVRDQKICYVTFTLGNTYDKDIRYVNTGLGLVKLKEENDGFSVLGSDDSLYEDGYPYTIGSMFYLKEAEYKELTTDGITVPANSELVCHAAFFADADSVDDYFITTAFDGPDFYIRNPAYRFIDIRSAAKN